jgi:hypothetical protein
MRSLFFRIIFLAAFFGMDLKAEDQTDLNTFPKCSKEELMMFFPQPIVKSVLLNAHISENNADEIAKDLANKDRGMAKIVDEKASQFNPNPFKDLSQRDQAIKIYQETLFEVFANVLKSHGINDENQIRSLLDEVRTVKSKQFIECMRQEAPH